VLDGARAQTADADTYRQLSLFGDVFERLRADYVEKPDDSKLIESAINGMLAGLDPHSSYMDSNVTSLVAHLMPKESVDIPADLKEAAAFRLQLLIHATTSLGSPRPFMGTVIIDDVGLARFLSDLSRRLGIGRGPKIETRPELVARREQQEREKGN
jgi:C-terminal processing protease CtpA/Prc